MGVRELTTLLKEIGLRDPKNEKRHEKSDKSDILVKDYYVDDAETKMLFSYFDFERDGSVELAELRSRLNGGKEVDVIYTVKILRGHIKDSGKNLKQFFDSLNRDKNKAIDFWEFYGLIRKLVRSLNIIQIDELFDFIDQDNSGEVDEIEFANAFNYFSQKEIWHINTGFFRKLTEKDRKNYQKKYGISDVDFKDKMVLDDEFEDPFMFNESPSKVVSSRVIVPPSHGFEVLPGMQGARPNMFFESQFEMPTNSAPPINPMQSNMMAPNMMNPMQSNMMAPNMMNPMQSNMMNYLLNDIVLLFQRDVLNFTNQNFMGSL
jgi:Ca2+-binding EF-hand superfamily protein